MRTRSVVRAAEALGSSPVASCPLACNPNACSGRSVNAPGEDTGGWALVLDSNLKRGMEASTAPEAVRGGRRWELRWCSSDFVEEGVGVQTNWCWAPSEQHRTLRRVTRGRSLAQLRAQSPHELPHGPVELSAFATERQCNGAQSELASAAETHDVALERPAKTQRSSRDTFGFSKLPDIKEDEELMEQAQMNDENEPPAGSDDDAVVPPLRRSGRDRKLPHVRRESSGMVDSSRSRSARNSNSLDDGNDVDADDADAGAVGMPGVRRSSRERKLPHVRRESSGMVDSSQLKWNRSTREVGNSKTNATSANAAPAELNFLAMAKTLKQRGASD